jgi:hypothetical protein
MTGDETVAAMITMAAASSRPLILETSVAVQEPDDNIHETRAQVNPTCDECFLVRSVLARSDIDGSRLCSTLISFLKKRRRMRCKDYFRAQKCYEYLLLSGDPEQRCDERRLPSCITPR